MKVGIRFGDNDFSEPIKAFFYVFILPTFEQKELGHPTTYLTSFQIVELFNRHVPHLERYLRWQEGSKRDFEKRFKDGIIKAKLHSDWLKINESQVLWDKDHDKLMGEDSGLLNGDYVWTDGFDVYVD